MFSILLLDVCSDRLSILLIKTLRVACFFCSAIGESEPFASSRTIRPCFPCPLPRPSRPAFGNHPASPIAVQAPRRSPFGVVAHEADPPLTARRLRAVPALPHGLVRLQRAQGDLLRGRVGGRRAPAPRPTHRALHHRGLAPRRALQRRRACQALQRRRRLGRGARAALRHHDGCNPPHDAIAGRRVGVHTWAMPSPRESSPSPKISLSRGRCPKIECAEIAERPDRGSESAWDRRASTRNPLAPERKGRGADSGAWEETRPRPHQLRWVLLSFVAACAFVPSPSTVVRASIDEEALATSAALELRQRGVAGGLCDGAFEQYVAKRHSQGPSLPRSCSTRPRSLADTEIQPQQLLAKVRTLHTLLACPPLVLSLPHCLVRLVVAVCAATLNSCPVSFDSICLHFSGIPLRLASSRRRQGRQGLHGFL
jgi:hypothetical protein